MSAKTTYSANNILIVLHCIHCVVLQRMCKIITQKSVKFWCSFWKNLHRTEKNYTGTARGAHDKYEVCMKYLCWLRCRWGTAFKEVSGIQTPSCTIVVGTALQPVLQKHLLCRRSQGFRGWVEVFLECKGYNWPRSIEQSSLSHQVRTHEGSTF